MWKTYSRQQAGRGKGNSTNALETPGNGDTGPSDQLTRRTLLVSASAAVVTPALPATRRLNVNAEHYTGVIFAVGCDLTYCKNGRLVPFYGDPTAPTPAEIREIEIITAALLAGDHVDGPRTRALVMRLRRERG